MQTVKIKANIPPKSDNELVSPLFELACLVVILLVVSGIELETGSLDISLVTIFPTTLFLRINN
jgi:hypothetical protein